MSQGHYDNLAESFEENWLFTDSYMRELVDLICKELSFFNGCSFLDLGCGTGNYTQAIVENYSLQDITITGVDFSFEMISEFKSKLPTSNAVVSGAAEFILENSKTYDFVLMKEVIHHVENYDKFFEGLKKRLHPSNGVGLIVTRPQNVDFPFFKKALEHFKVNQVSTDELTKAISSQNLMFEVINTSINISINKLKMFKMIENKFMSTFDSFSSEEMSDGLHELSLKFENDDILSFDDRLIFIKVFNK